MSGRMDTVRPDGMWKLVFYERAGMRVQVDRSAPWLPNRAAVEKWAQYFSGAGYHLALMSQDGKVVRLSKGLPG